MAEQMSKVKVTNLVLGTMIAKFELPLSLVDDINKLYDEKKEGLKPHNKVLAGKIEDEKLMDNILTKGMKEAFLDCFRQYMQICQKPYWHCFPENAWINEMKAGEYNPMHYHHSPLSDLGLSSVLMLKRPSTYGKEASNDDEPSNGRLLFTGGDQSPLSIELLQIDAMPGDFFVFPYSLLHGVYPFNGTDEVRRTMSYNCNLFKDTQFAIHSETDKEGNIRREILEYGGKSGQSSYPKNT